MTEEDRKRVRGLTLWHVPERCPEHGKRLIADGKWIMCPVDGCTHKVAFAHKDRKEE